jgi:hypothetical protein
MQGEIFNCKKQRLLQEKTLGGDTNSGRVCFQNTEMIQGKKNARRSSTIFQRNKTKGQPLYEESNRQQKDKDNLQKNAEVNAERKTP